MCGIDDERNSLATRGTYLSGSLAIRPIIRDMTKFVVTRKKRNGEKESGLFINSQLKVYCLLVNS